MLGQNTIQIMDWEITAWLEKNASCFAETVIEGMYETGRRRFRRLKAAEAGHLRGWHIVGDIYWDGKAVKRDLAYALQCCEKTAVYGNDSYACRQLGRMYFHGWGTAAGRTRRGEKRTWRKARTCPIKTMAWE